MQEVGAPSRRHHGFKSHMHYQERAVSIMEISEKEREIILEFAKCDMKAAPVGRNLYMNRNTVVYHLDKVKKRTGIDYRSFYGLVKLVKLAGGEFDDP